MDINCNNNLSGVWNGVITDIMLTYDVTDTWFAFWFSLSCEVNIYTIYIWNEDDFI